MDRHKFEIAELHSRMVELQRLQVAYASRYGSTVIDNAMNDHIAALSHRLSELERAMKHQTNA